MTNSAGPQEPSTRLIQLWVESLSSVLGQIAAKPFAFEIAEAPSEAVEATDKDLYITVTAAGAVRGEMCLHIPQASAAALAKIFAGEPASAAELTADDRGAVEELLRQVAGHVSTGAKAISQEFPITVALGQPPTWPAAASGWIRSGAETPAQIVIEWRLSAALNTSLAAVAEQAQKSPTNETAASPPDPNRLGFFMGLELDVTLRFGGRDILLKDILQLGPGSVLELDREIQDPADLLLDGRLIARGEVVMVDGNYGLRVTEVLAGPQIPMQ